MADERCEYCGVVVGPSDDWHDGPVGKVHAACVEAAADAPKPENPMRRFMTVWWGAGHH